MSNTPEIGKETKDVQDDNRSLSPITPQSSSRSESEARETKKLKLWIELRHLPPEEEQTYEKVPTEPDRIVGELKEDGEHYVFALFDTIAYRYTLAQAKDLWLDKVDEFLTKRDTGELEKFDPTSSMVHPASRPKRPTIKVHPSANRRQLRPRPPTLRKVTSGDDSDNVDDAAFKPKSRIQEESDEDELNYVISDDDIPVRRSKRSAAARGNAKLKQSTLNFGSSRKLRRTSNRTIQSNSEEEEEGSEEEEVFPPKIQKVPRPKLHKPITPGYGAIHYAGYDYDVDAQLDNGRTKKHFMHCGFCEACSEVPAHEQLQDLRATEKGRRNFKEVSRIKELGGWVLCLKCCNARHWNCLGDKERDDIKRAILTKENSSKKDRRLSENETTDYICGHCSNGSICMFCRKVAVKKETLTSFTKSTLAPKPEASTTAVKPSKEEERKSIVADSEPETERKSQLLVAITDETNPDNTSTITPIIKTEPLIFRCNNCDRAAHYECLPPPSKFSGSTEDLLIHYQEYFRCPDCEVFGYYKVESLLAWRPQPENAPQPKEDSVNYKANLPREYLVKWQDRGFNRCQWVAHAWLQAKAPSILRNFIEKGSRIPLLEKHPSPDAAKYSNESSRAQSVFGDDADNAVSEGGMAVASDEVWQASFKADPLAEQRIPPAWKRVDRLLDVLFWKPRSGNPKDNKKATRKSNRVESSEDEVESKEESGDSELMKQRLSARDEAIKPDEKFMESFAKRKKRCGEVTKDDARHVAWAYIKWDELPHEQSTWDAPPSTISGLKSFDAAFDRFLMAEEVNQEEFTSNYLKHRDSKVKAQNFVEFEEPPELGQDAKFNLFPFQLQGVSWLYGQWIQKRSCILADEMGLGKTIQMASFIGYLNMKWQATPSLVVVPKSTLINWLREFARWAPRLVVAPYFGEKKSRQIMRDYEVFRSESPKKGIGIKFHVLVTTYETITNPGNMSAVFNKVPRWELLVVDEGQKLKSDSSQIFRKLKDLRSAHRVIMTGTPLNNNIRELFNLMNFLDEDEWFDLDQLEKDHQELTEQSVAELHERLKPYFLRRLKIDVLDLPPKNEVIVPVSMTPLQKEVYRHVLSNSIDAIEALMRSKMTGKKAPAKKSLNNTLMQLRKCLQHPYLINQDLEQHGLSATETLNQLVDASAKLRLLRVLLPKLKARGHRVLLFSQFKIALDIIDDFLAAEGYSYLRLDGDSPQNERQKGMDEFNKPNSEYFIYILTTRAGGVGINLSSADTVIIFDPDFNPHQDLQAIARSYRYGLQRTCLVFKLMVRDSAEEKIMQIAKKKLVLDHLIVQKMDEEDPSEDLQSILTYGAQTLFDENGQQQTTDITYSDADLDKLIERTETEIQPKEKDPSSQHASNQALKFDYAKLWVVERNTLEEVKDSEDIEGDSWAELLAKARAEAAKTITSEKMGRGSRRRAAIQAAAQTKLIQAGLASPDKKSRKRTPKSDKSVDVDFAVSDRASSSSEGSEYTGGADAKEDLLDLDVPLFLPNPSEDAAIRGSSAITTITSQPVARSQPPTIVPAQFVPMIPGPNASHPPHPAFMFPPQPYPPFPLRFPDRVQQSDQKQLQPSGVSMKRSFDPNGSMETVALAGKESRENRPHKKARKEENVSHVQTSQALPDFLPQARGKITEGPKQNLPTEGDVRISKALSEPVIKRCSVCTKSHEDGACLVEEEKELLEYRSMILNEAGDETPDQKQQVLKLIEKKRRHIHSKLAELRRPQSTLTTGTSNDSHIHPVSSTELSATSSKPMQSIQLQQLTQPHSTSFPISISKSQQPIWKSYMHVPSPLASTSTTTSTPGSAAIKPAVAKGVSSSDEKCVACNNSWHPLKECPLITAGPDSVKQVIKKLRNDPEKVGVVLLLRSIREKQKKKQRQA